MFRRLRFVVLSFMISAVSFSASLSFQNLNRVKVDDLSDVEISQFVKKYTGAGYTLADVERMAQSKNMPSTELEKLKVRISALEASASSVLADEKISTEMTGVKSDETNVGVGNSSKKNSRVYGMSVFNNSKISFEPSQSVATPRNYRLGANDVLHIDVYGMAEATYDWTVSKDGNIRIPNVGVVFVDGMTLEQAENVIKKKLSTLYNSINSGRTSVAVSINHIRSIKVYILGEVENPGSYTLSSVSSVFNAMNACGGPSENGSMRNVQLIRNGRSIAKVDLYEFLQKGAMPSDMTLQDQDVIQVPPYENRVTVNGAVKREGVYELKTGETLQQLIDYCGGFTDDAYTERISVVRNTNGEKSVADVTKELFPMFAPASGDVYSVDRILEKYSNRVQILGSVFRPGSYALEEGMSLKDLVMKANGLTEDAFMQGATLVRLQEDLTPEIISFNVKDLMEGNFNIALQKEDVVTIGCKTDFEPKKNIAIYGAVMSPGEFPYYENITLKDLVFLAKGFREEADPTKIELIRKVMDGNVLSQDKDKVEIYNFALDKDLNGSDGAFQLMPNDKVTIRRMEGYENLGKVEILGEVKNPGVFVIKNKTERLSSMLARAGGVSRYAFVDGAFLIRKSNRTQAEKRRDKKLIQIIKGNDFSTEGIKKLIENREDMVGINLAGIIKHPGKNDDLIVEDGDMLFVPSTKETVTISGAVQVPGMEVYCGKSLRKYLRGVGGFEKNARKKGTYVSYMNGSVRSTRHFLWWRNYPNVKAGAHVFVPEKPERSEEGKANATFFVSLFSSVATMASVIVTAISVISK